jgi:hypothetical protein
VPDHERPERGAEERVDLSGLGRLSERPPPPRREKAAPVVRGLSVFLLAIAAAGLPWYFLTKTDREPAAPDTGATGSATTSPTPSPTQSGGTYEIFGVSSCVNLRADADTSSERLDCLVPGVRLESDGRTKEGDGLLWRHVRYQRRSLEGWVADKYLKPVP